MVLETLHHPCGCEIVFIDSHPIQILLCGTCPPPALQLGLALSASVTEETEEIPDGDKDEWWASVLRDGPQTSYENVACVHSTEEDT